MNEKLLATPKEPQVKGTPGRTYATIRALDPTGRYYEVALDLPDLGKLRQLFDVTRMARISVGKANTRKAYVLTKDIVDKDVRQRYEAERIQTAPLHHLFLGYPPASARVRFKDGNNLNLRRSNLITPPRTPTERLPRRHSKAEAFIQEIEAPQPAVPLAAKTGDQATYSVTKELQPVWVIRCRGKIVRTLLGTEADAKLALAEELIG